MQSYPVIIFLTGTFALSLIAFGFMYVFPAAQSPEGWPGLPVWLIAVWSPSIMAMLLAHNEGTLSELLLRLIAFKGLGMSWLIISFPLVILLFALLFNWSGANFKDLSPGLVLVLFGLNLVLGPLGEELGWRGFLQPNLEARFGWLAATLLVSAIWAIWHAPLWTIASPQSEIPFLIFCVHVLSYGILIAVAQSLAPHSLVPAVLLHLLFNVTAGFVLLTGIADTPRWYSISAVPYLMIAVLAALFIHKAQRGAGIL